MSNKRLLQAGGAIFGERGQVLEHVIREYLYMYMYYCVCVSDWNQMVV